MPFSQQSPINLDGSVYAELGSEVLDIRWKKKGNVSGELIKTDHGLKVLFFPDSRQSIRLGQASFHLTEFHFHHPSEHWSKGQQRFMELHAVHRSVDNGTSFCVLGIFIDITDDRSQESKGFRQFLDKVKNILHPTFGEPPSHIVHIHPWDFLPASPEDYYRYEGSLTTGEHDETVSWVVMKNALKLTMEPVGELIADFKAPARNPLPMNRRFLLRTFRDD